MDENAIAEYIKNNLSIDVDWHYAGMYDTSIYIQIDLKLKGQVFATTTVTLPTSSRD